MDIDNLTAKLNDIPREIYFGRVTAVQGLFVEVTGIRAPVTIGDRCTVETTHGKKVPCELVSFKEDRLLMMPYGSLDGIGPGCRVDVDNASPVIYPHPSWLGRIINAFGEPIDGKGDLVKGDRPCYIKNSPPPAQFRDRVKGKVDLGVRAVNTFLTVCKGQRMGIFAGSGVGKSTLMSMMAKNTDSDIAVIGLIGERGREAKEFVEDVLGEDGLAKSVLVLATSNESPLMRRQAAYTAMAVSEYFRDQNKNVLCMMDSITRFAMAQREISLSVGEPPASKGYTPSCWNGPGREPEPEVLPDYLRFWSTEMIIMSRWLMPCAEFWTGILFWTGQLPSATVIRPLIFCVLFPVPCLIVIRRRNMLWWPRRANISLLMRIWPSLSVWALIKKVQTPRWTKLFFIIPKSRIFWLRKKMKK